MSKTPPRRLLLITFYYAPDLCAGSFRAAALVRALEEVADAEVAVDVLTTSPNRYQTYNAPAAAFEQEGRVTIRRIPVGGHQSGMLDQSIAFARFARGVIAATRHGEWDLVVATSSRLMTAALAGFVASRRGLPLYLDIRDLFVDTMSNVLKGPIASLALPILRRLESQTMARATRINLVSAGFVPDLKRVSPRHDCRTFTNGIDDDFLTADFGASSERRDEALILYAGNIGEGQGLHATVPEVARRLMGRARFRIIGDGGRRAALERAVTDAQVDNVEIVDPMSRSELVSHYREADILFLQLNDYPAFRKVLPSKIFEYAVTGRPILAGVTGFSADFLCSEVDGVRVYPPGDTVAMGKAIADLLGGPRRFERSEFSTRYARSRIMTSFALDILDLATHA